MQFFAKVPLPAIGGCFSYRQTQWSSFMMIMMAVILLELKSYRQSRRSSIRRMMVSVCHGKIAGAGMILLLPLPFGEESSIHFLYMFWFWAKPRAFLQIMGIKPFNHHTCPTRERTHKMVIVYSIYWDMSLPHSTTKISMKINVTKISKIYFVRTIILPQPPKYIERRPKKGHFETNRLVTQPTQKFAPGGKTPCCCGCCLVPVDEPCSDA